MHFKPSPQHVGPLYAAPPHCHHGPPQPKDSVEPVEPDPEPTGTLAVLVLVEVTLFAGIFVVIRGLGIETIGVVVGGELFSGWFVVIGLLGPAD